MESRGAGSAQSVAASAVLQRRETGGMYRGTQTVLRGYTTVVDHQFVNGIEKRVGGSNQSDARRVKKSRGCKEED